MMTPTPGDEDEMGEPMECHGDYDDADAVAEKIGLPELQFTVKEPTADDPCFAFVGPRNATAGWTVFSLEYPAPGRTFHIMPMFFIGSHTVDEVMAAFASESEPEWATPAGAVGGVTPGQSGSLAVELKEGSYMFFCPIEGHMMKGMMGVLNVTAASEERAEPEADAEIDLVDYNFTVPANLSADAQVIKVTNKGTEPHEAPLVQLQGNATAMEFIEAVESETPTGPPPGALIGGTNTILPGTTVYMIVDFDAGTRYAMACFVESESHGGAPHLELGMVKEFAPQ
jgi:uncharacterized cupredoxin-like copper-binding protein